MRGGERESDGDLVADSNREGHTGNRATVMNQFFASQDVTATLWAFAVLKELPGMELMDALRRRALIVMPQVLILLDLLVQKYKY